MRLGQPVACNTGGVRSGPRLGGVVERAGIPSAAGDNQSAKAGQVRGTVNTHAP